MVARNDAPWTVPSAPRPEWTARVLASLGSRWNQGSVLIRKVTGARPPSLEVVLAGERAVSGDAERLAWEVYVETVVPLVRSGQIEGIGNFGVRSDDPTEDVPCDHPFVRVRRAFP